MSTQVQYRRGSNVQVAAFTGALGELVIDTTNKIVVVNDGTTVGGFPQVGLTASQTLTNKIYQGTSASVTGNITASYFLGNGSQLSGIDATSIQSGTSNVRVVSSGGNVTVGVGGTSNIWVAATTGIYVTGLQSVTGNITGGNVLTGGLISATGNATIGGDINIVGNIVDTGPMTLITSSNGNISLLPNGTGNVNIGANIMPTANATANIGSASFTYNTIFAKATSAQYADLAENYSADTEYAPGTVLEFGGDKEVTQTTAGHRTQVAGIISTNPSYLMNAGQTGSHVVAVALTGRVPCQVVGNIVKGDRLVSSNVAGVATVLDMSQYQPGCIIGKALENYNSQEIGQIEVAVGRF
jgi:hypothetical protein